MAEVTTGMETTIAPPPSPAALAPMKDAAKAPSAASAITRQITAQRESVVERGSSAWMKQPRADAGSPEGGQFVTKPGAQENEGGLVPLKDAQAAFQDESKAQAMAALEKEINPPAEGEGEGEPVAPAVPAEGEDGATGEPTGEAPGEVGPGETEVPGSGDGDGDETPAWVTVGLPPRREGDPEFELELQDPDAVEAVNRLNNGYLRGEDYARRLGDVESREMDLRTVEDSIRVDPAGFMIDQMPVERREEVALRLLSDDAIYTAAITQLTAWGETPQLREATAMRLAAEATTRVAQHTAQRTQQATLTSHAENVLEAIIGLVPGDAGPDDANDFIQDAKFTIQQYTRENRVVPGVEDVQRLLQRRLRQYGFEPAPGADNGGQRNGRSVQRTRGRTLAARPEGTTPASDGEGIRQRAEARKKVAPAAPAGAGAGGTVAQAVRPPPGSNLQEAFEHADKMKQAGLVKFTQ